MNHTLSKGWDLLNTTLFVLKEFSIPTYLVDPGHVGADSGEHRGLLGVVATHTGAETDHTMDVPGAIRVLAVQGATRISL